jgi:hypothetical protein
VLGLNVNVTIIAADALQLPRPLVDAELAGERPQQPGVLGAETAARQHQASAAGQSGGEGSILGGRRWGGTCRRFGLPPAVRPPQERDTLQIEGAAQGVDEVSGCHRPGREHIGHQAGEAFGFRLRTGHLERPPSQAVDEEADRDADDGEDEQADEIDQPVDAQAVVGRV